MAFSSMLGHLWLKKIPSTIKNPTEYITQNTEIVFAINPVSDNEILKLIGDLKDSASGWDGLRPNMIKHVKEHIKLPLTHICNLSFSTGVFPCELKIANVVPIFKANDEMIFSNYRPVSILPVLSKLIEIWCTIDWFIISMKTSCYININLVSRQANLLTWP